MNKKILFAVMGVAAVGAIATGCEQKKEEGNNNQNNNEPAKAEDKKLVCTLTESSEEDHTEEVKYTFNFKEDDFDKVTLLGTFKYKSGKYDEKQADDLAKECTDDLKDAKGLTCNVQRSGSSIWITYQFTIADLNDAGKEAAEKAGLDELSGKKYDEIKTVLTAGGFKCE